MFQLQDLIPLAVLPLVAAGLVMLLWKRLSPSSRGDFVVATLVAFAIGKMGLEMRDQLGVLGDASRSITGWWQTLAVVFKKLGTPSSGKDWLIPLSVLAPLLFFGSQSLLGFDNRYRRPVRTRENSGNDAMAEAPNVSDTPSPKYVWARFAVFGGCLIVAALVSIRLLWGSIYFGSAWARVQRFANIGFIGVSIAIPLYLLQRVPPQRRLNSRPLMLAMPFLALVMSAGCLLLTGSKTYGELGTVIAFTYLGATLVTIHGERTHALADYATVAILLAGLMVLASAFSSTPVWQVAILGYSLLGLILIVELAARRPQVSGATKRWWLASLSMMLPIFVLLVWNAIQFNRAISSNPYSQYL